MLRAALALVVCATSLPTLGCGDAMSPPGARGQTVPRHIKSPSYDRRNVPTTPMTTQHVLEVHDHCGLRCNFLQNATTSITLHLQESGAATAHDEGRLIERLSSTTSTHAQQTTWQRRWSGTWTEAEDTLRIMLKPDTAECQRQSDRGGVEPNCAQPHELRLHCDLVSLPLVRPRNANAKAWSCRPRGYRADDAISPLPWVFGVSERVVVLDGGNRHEPSRRYALEK